MFKFTDIKNDIDRSANVEKMTTSFSPLKSKIELICSYEIGVNLKNTEFSYDIAIISEFKSWVDLETYIEHPEHQKAINLCKDIKKEKAIVDYEF